MLRGEIYLLFMVYAASYMQKVCSLSITRIKHCKVENHQPDEAVLELCEGNERPGKEDPPVPVAENQSLAEVLNLNVQLKYKPNGEPNFLITFCTSSPADVTSMYTVSISNNQFLSNNIYCANLIESGNKGADGRVNKTYSFELSCLDAIKVDQNFFVDVFPSDGSGAVSSFEYVVPNCDDPQMKLTQQCKAIERRKIIYTVSQNGGDKLIAQLDKSTYKRPFNTVINFGIKERDTSSWFGWGPIQHYQKLTSPNHTAVFPDLKPGVVYVIMAWRAQEQERFGKMVMIGAQKKKKEKDAILKRTNNTTTNS